MRHGKRLGLAACLVAAVTVVCYDDRGLTESSVSREWLTGNALAALGTDGRFHLRAIQRHPTAEVNNDQAVEIATHWAHMNGPWIRSALEQDRGAPVDPAKVQQCGRIFYADTPYEDLPPTASAALNSVYGPWWLVTLCDNSEPAMSIGVSAYSTNLKIVGGVVTGVRAEIFPTGIPKDLPSIPMSPEEAVAMAAAATGARIAEPPLLIMGPREAPQTAKWLITLDRPTMIRGTHSGIVRNTTTILVGFEKSVMTKAIQANDPTAPATVVAGDVAAVGPGKTPPTVDVAARAGFATGIERVEVLRQEPQHSAPTSSTKP